MSNKRQETMDNAFGDGCRALSEEVPVGYKRTEVGVIPEDWECGRLGDLTMRVGSGITPSGGERVYVPEGRPFLRSQNVGWGVLDLADLAFITDELHASFAESKIEEGDVLLNIIGASIGRSAVADITVARGNVNQNVCAIRTDPKRLDPRFLNSYLLSVAGQKQIDSQAGGTRQSLNCNQIRSFLILRPTLSEQTAIAEALSDVDGLLAALEALIAKKRAVKQAAMQELLTGKTRLPGFSGAWETKGFGEVFKRLNGKAHQIQTSEYSTHGLHPVIDQGQDYIVAFSDRTDKLFECSNGGVIVFGDHTRIAKFIDVNFLIGADGVQLLTMQGDGVTKFFFYQLLTKDIPNTGYNRHFKFLKDLTFKVPTLSEQTAIAAVLSDMDAEIAALERRRDKTRAVKQGMMQQLLTGRVRLFNPE